jgi:hypothetical protein
MGEYLHIHFSISFGHPIITQSETIITYFSLIPKIILKKQ